MERSWNRFVRYPVPADHAVQIYRAADELAESVAAYLSGGFDAGEPALVLATPEHRRLFAARLADHGHDAAELEATGLLTLDDAASTLSAIMVDGTLSSRRFVSVVGGRLDEVGKRFPGRPIRAFGELVDLLCARGDPETAAALEREWHRLALERRFSLLCGYELDVFDQETQASILPEVCRAHSHVLVASDPDRLHRAVDAALEETLGAHRTGHVYSLIAPQIRETSVPASQLALMWVSREMPALAGRILRSARAGYLAQPTA